MTRKKVLVYNMQKQTRIYGFKRKGTTTHDQITAQGGIWPTVHRKATHKSIISKTGLYFKGIAS